MSRDLDLITIECQGKVLTYCLCKETAEDLIKNYQKFYPDDKFTVGSAKVPTELTNEQIKANIWKALQEPLD